MAVPQKNLHNSQLCIRKLISSTCTHNIHRFLFTESLNYLYEMINKRESGMMYRYVIYGIYCHRTSHQMELIVINTLIFIHYHK